MNNQRKLSNKLKTAACMLALTLGVSAYAAAPAPEDGPRGEHPFAARMKHRLDELHQQLALDKNQEAQWQSAQEASRKAMREGMEARRAGRDRAKAELNKPNPDLRALAAQMDEEREAHAQKHKAVREAWLKFYDGLNDTQKEKARQFILGMITRMEEFGHGGRRDMKPGHDHKGPPPDSGKQPQ